MDLDNNEQLFGTGRDTVLPELNLQNSLQDKVGHEDVQDYVPVKRRKKLPFSKPGSNFGEFAEFDSSSQKKASLLLKVVEQNKQLPESSNSWKVAGSEATLLNIILVKISYKIYKFLCT